MNVTPREVEANGLVNPFTNVKKWTIVCGHCLFAWTQKVPAREPSQAICPNCRAVNKWSIKRFLELFDDCNCLMRGRAR